MTLLTCHRRDLTFHPDPSGKKFIYSNKGTTSVSPVMHLSAPAPSTLAVAPCTVEVHVNRRPFFVTIYKNKNNGENESVSI